MLVIPKEIEFDLRHQITLHLCPDINGLLGNENGDSGTIRSNCSDATLAIFKIAPSDSIDYLILRPTTPIPTPTTAKETPTVRMIDPNDNADSSMIAPPTIPNNTTNSKDNAPTTLQSLATLTSIEVALNIRSEEFKVD